jgi:hypothetical protein
MRHRSRWGLTVSLVLVMVAVPALPRDVEAWGCLGHIIVAQIAADQLTDQARAAVGDLLAGRSLAQVSCWADEVRPARPETRRWHYADIPRLAVTYDPKRDCAPTPEGDCIIAAIVRSLSTLKHGTRPREERAEALRFLVHLLGDLHQPLHCADDHDRGGNEVTVTFLDGSDNLHGVWDTGLVGELMRVDPAMTARLIRAAREDRGARRGTIVEWALESHAVAVERVYGTIPADRQLRATYVDAQRPTVEQALRRAGVRLATALNRGLAIGCASGPSPCR